MSSCETPRSLIVSDDGGAYGQRDGENITPQPRSIAAVHIQPPITIRKITAPPTLPGQAPREGLQAVSPRGDGLPPGLKARPIYSPEHTSAVRLHRSVTADHGSICHKALRRTMRWVRDCSAVAASSVSHQQLLATAAIQPPRQPLPRRALGLRLDGPLCMLGAPLRLIAAAAAAVRGGATIRGYQYTALPLEAAAARPVSHAVRPTLSSSAISEAAPLRAPAI
eukprot:jgi/Ulvmu1/672/UM010_0044.1